MSQRKERKKTSVHLYREQASNKRKQTSDIREMPVCRMRMCIPNENASEYHVKNIQSSPMLPGVYWFYVDFFGRVVNFFGDGQLVVVITLRFPQWVPLRWFDSCGCELSGADIMSFSDLFKLGREVLKTETFVLHEAQTRGGSEGIQDKRKMMLQCYC